MRQFCKCLYNDNSKWLDCHKCHDDSGLIPEHYILCKECGNKRCPKASDHNIECTNSNEPGQEGSVYK